MPRPLSVPSRERLALKPHGTRLRYMGGCRCLPCRAANSNAETRYRRLRMTGRGNPIVDAAAMRRHVERLSTQGLGYKRVARLAGVSISTVGDVLFGRQDGVRRAIADRVLKVRATLDVLAPSALIPVGPTKAIVDRLMRDGYPAARLATLLGYRSPKLQILRSPTITVRNARRVRDLAAWLLAEDDGDQNKATQEVTSEAQGLRGGGASVAHRCGRVQEGAYRGRSTESAAGR